MRGAFYSWTEASGEGSRGDAAVRRHSQLPHRLAGDRLPRGRRRALRCASMPGELAARCLGESAIACRRHRGPRSSAEPTFCRRRCSATSSRFCAIGPAEDVGRSLALLCGVVAFAVVCGAGDARGAAAASSASIRPTTPSCPLCCRFSRGSCANRAPAGTPWRRGWPTSRRGDGAGVARRSVATTRAGGSRRCATRSSGRRSRRCTATPGTPGRWASLAAALRCRARPSPRASRRSSERRRWLRRRAPHAGSRVTARRRGDGRRRRPALRLRLGGGVQPGVHAHHRRDAGTGPARRRRVTLVPERIYIHGNRTLAAPAVGPS